MTTSRRRNAPQCRSFFEVVQSYRTVCTRLSYSPAGTPRIRNFHLGLWVIRICCMEDKKASGCDVCGTIVPEDAPDGYLRFETDIDILGSVCSWECAANFAVKRLSEWKDS